LEGFKVIFYPWYPADYLADTLHLSTLEDCFYRRMLDWCYMHERGLPIRRKQTYSLMRARTTAEKKAVDKILDLYFHKDPSNGGEMISFRVRKEIVRYLILREKRSCAGKQRHLQSAHAEHVLSYQNQNQIKSKSKTLNSSSSQDQAIKPLERESAHAPRATLAPLTLDAVMVAYAEKKHLNAQREFEKFAAYNAANGKRIKNLHRTWELWCLRAPQFNGDEPQGPTIDEQIAEYERNTGLDFYTQKPKRNTQPD
jgi:uncharacterized protein YdaU (DUF1376 family)